MKCKLLILAAVLFNISIAVAQSPGEIDSKERITISDDVDSPKKNNFKISLTSLIFGNYQLQYERSLTKRIGLVVGYSFIPKGAVPFRTQLNDLTADSEDTQGIFENAELGYKAFTPEVRFYLGKGYGKGFYVAPFYRNVRYDITNVNFTFSSDFAGVTEQNLAMGGKLSANSFGLQLGAQFHLGKHIILDWWIVGPHYGTSKGDFVGITDRNLTTFEQQELKKELDNIELPLSDIKTEVNARGAKINVSGPWGGVRSGISLGYRF
jgi:hypothetical protein